VFAAIARQSGQITRGLHRAPERLHPSAGSHSENNVYSVRIQLLAFIEGGIPTLMAGGTDDDETPLRSTKADA
jgi:hypothetical protein